MQRVDVGGFILFQQKNVAKELELSKDDRRQQRVNARETVDSITLEFVKMFDV